MSRVLLIVPDYAPVLNSAARLFEELAADLRAAGHEVTVLTRVPDRYLAPGAPALPKDPEGLRVIRVPSIRVPPRVIPLRALQQVVTSARLMLASRGLPRQDVVIVYYSHLPYAWAGARAARRSKARLVLNVQDIYPDTAVDLGLMTSRPLIRLAAWLARRSYARADALVVHSEGNRTYLIGKGAEAAKTHVVHNWVDLEQLRRGPRSDAFRRQHGLEGKFVVSFAGTMGFAQGLDEVVAAAALVPDEDVVWVLAGDGALKPQLEAEVARRGLRNVKFLPPQPPDAYAALLGASDVSLVTLHPGLKTPVVPGKLQSAMAAGVAVLCAAHPASDAKPFLERAGAGAFVPAGDPAALAAAVRQMAKDPEGTRAMGERGRDFAAAQFERSVCTGDFEELVRKLTKGA